jgi:lysophospholipase L1-like esterase
MSKKVICVSIVLLLLQCFNAIAATYQSGDSLTVGYGASASRGWAQMLGSYIGGSVVNTAVSGSMVPDQAAAVYSKNYTSADKATLMLGTNDERIYGSNASKQALFKDGMYALSVYMASHVTKARDSGVYSGAWENTVAYGIGKSSYTNGSKLSFTFDGTTLYLAYIKQVSNGGQFTVKIDGVAKGTFFSDGTGINTALGATYGPQMARFSGLSNAEHHVEIEVISATSSSNRVYIDWWTTPNARTPLFIGNIPYATAYASGGSSANVDAYNEELSTMVNTLSSDGINIRLVDVNSILTASDMYDSYHPNDAGYIKIYTIFQQLMFPPCN